MRTGAGNRIRIANLSRMSQGMAAEHSYTARVTWTGNRGEGTRSYGGYGRDHDIACPGKPLIRSSADTSFRGDAERHNPEDLLVAALSACHMLWYLHLCASAGVVVTAYEDNAEGTMRTGPDGSGEFTKVTLRPRVTVGGDSDPAMAECLHAKAGALCFIARSVSFPVAHVPETVSE